MGNGALAIGPKQSAHPRLYRFDHSLRRRKTSGIEGIVLQKSKVAGPRIFRENMNREEIADSYRLNRVAEAAGEFSARR
jgi:hypothetical protein